MTHSARNRRGLSLIEMLVVITASAIVIGMVAGMIQMLIRAERAAQDHLVRTATADQLARSFRQHVRAAVQADSEQRDGTATLQLKVGENAEVEFRSRKDAVIRIDREAGQVRRQEKYSLPARSVARFETHDDAGTTTVSLVVIHQPSATEQAPTRELRVEATLGRDHRFVPRGD